jgi:hypothetical protein
MEMSIQGGKLVKDIQKEFSELYPFLKIELTDKKQQPKAVPGNDLPGEPRLVDISGNRTVAQLEDDFKTNLRLPIQVFRRAGSLWIETSFTDDWTLDQQNKEGELFSNLHANISNK